MRFVLLSGLLAFALLAGLVSPTAAASSVLVVNATDNVDDGSCDAQHCSLREALIAAGANPGGDRIAFHRDVFPRDVPIEILGAWFVPDDTELDGTGSSITLRGPGPTLALGSRTFIHGLTIDASDSTALSVVTDGDENVLSDNNLTGGVYVVCAGSDPARGNRVLRNEIVGGLGGVELRGESTCSVDGTVVRLNQISNARVGIFLSYTSNSTVTSNTVAGNQYGVEIEFQASDVHITRNNIAGNTDYGFINGTGSEVDAEHNWWGSSDGPSGEGPGAGDAILGTVDFEPWRRHPAHALK